MSFSFSSAQISSSIEFPSPWSCAAAGFSLYKAFGHMREASQERFQSIAKAKLMAATFYTCLAAVSVGLSIYFNTQSRLDEIVKADGFHIFPGNDLGVIKGSTKLIHSFDCVDMNRITDYFKKSIWNFSNVTELARTKFQNGCMQAVAIVLR